MELARYKACICEGSAENAIMDILLDHNLLIFSREEMIEEEIALAGGGSVSSADLSSLVSAIREGVSGMNGGGGDIVIPVYLGGTMLDEVIVNAQQRANLRSGGR